jgi:hypothetical protein
MVGHITQAKLPPITIAARPAPKPAIDRARLVMAIPSRRRIKKAVAAFTVRLSGTTDASGSPPHAQRLTARLVA